MYSNILVLIAFDHERDTNAALAVARQLRAAGGRITALNVEEEVPQFVARYIPEDSRADSREAITEALRTRVGHAEDVEVAVVTGHGGEAIVEYARDHGIDCIVIASHRPGVQDYFIGSTAARVVRHAPCAVHVVR